MIRDQVSNRARTQTQVCLKAHELNQCTALWGESKATELEPGTISNEGGTLVTTNHTTWVPREEVHRQLAPLECSGQKAGILLLQPFFKQAHR